MKAIRRASLAVLLLAVLAGAAPARAADTVRQRYLWDQATTILRHARTQDDFARAAEVYRALVESGVRNETVFYDYGTALLLARNYEEAAAALVRAERYGGTTPEIERNLRLAAARGGPVEDAVLPWYRVPLWWHFGLASPVRIAVTTLLFAAAWLALILRAGRWRRAVAPFLAATVAALVVFASSSAVSVYQEWRDRAESSVQTREQQARP
jgi:hypothetical protein